VGSDSSRAGSRIPGEKTRSSAGVGLKEGIGVYRETERVKERVTERERQREQRGINIEKPTPGGEPDRGKGADIIRMPVCLVFEV
jgi:hypothetical protein